MIQIWEKIKASFIEMGEQVGAFLPKLVVAVLILIVGYFIARFISKLVRMLLSKVGIDNLGEQGGINRFINRLGPEVTWSSIVGKIVFWLVMLIFVITATETLGMKPVSDGLYAFVGYLPQVFAAMIIIVVGMLLASFIRDLIERSGEAMGADYAEPLSKIIFGFIMLMVFLTAVKQLDIGTELTEGVVKIVLAAAGLALALALGLGTRDLAKQIIAGIYARDLYEPGNRITVGDESGTLQEVGTVSSRLNREDGSSVHIPNAEMIESVVKTEPE